MATIQTHDLIQSKLAQRYPGTDTNMGALLQRYRADNNLPRWEDYVAHVAGASASLNFGDDANAFWNAFVP